MIEPVSDLHIYDKVISLDSLYHVYTKNTKSRYIPEVLNQGRYSENAEELKLILLFFNLDPSYIENGFTRLKITYDKKQGKCTEIEFGFIDFPKQFKRLK